MNSYNYNNSKRLYDKKIETIGELESVQESGSDFEKFRHKLKQFAEANRAVNVSIAVIATILYE